MRRGRRRATPHAVLYFAPRAADQPARFGFVVAKTVGGAVTRNLMRRRMRAIASELLERGYRSTDVVVRALPGSEKLSWASLHEEISTGIERGA